MKPVVATEAENHPSPLVPYLCVKGAETAVAYYGIVFGGKEIERYQEEPGGPIGHVTLELCGAKLFMSDEFPSIGVLSPETIGGSSVTLHLSVDDVDDVTKLAVEGGAKLLREPANQPYGERNSKFIDPFGHIWMIATQIGDQ